MKRKVLALALAAAMAASLAACGGSSKPETTAAPVSYTHLDVYKRQAGASGLGRDAGEAPDPGGRQAGDYRF